MLAQCRRFSTSNSSEKARDSVKVMPYVPSGKITLVTDAGEEFLRGGDAAGFKAGDRNGHYLQNRWSADVQVLEIRVLPWRRTILASTWSVQAWCARETCPGGSLPACLTCAKGICPFSGRQSPCPTSH
jgi:hypothetical protein